MIKKTVSLLFFLSFSSSKAFNPFKWIYEWYYTKQLITAIVDNNTTLAKNAISNGAIIEWPNKNGNNSIHFSVLYNRPNILKNIINQRNIDINSKNSTGNTPLHLAAANNYVQCLILLLNASDNKNINILNNYSDTPLHLAALKNAKDAVNILVKRGAKRNLKNLSNKTPQDLALHLNYANIAKKLAIQSIDLRESMELTDHIETNTETENIKPIPSNLDLRESMELTDQIETNTETENIKPIPSNLDLREGMELTDHIETNTETENIKPIPSNLDLREGMELTDHIETNTETENIKPILSRTKKKEERRKTLKQMKEQAQPVIFKKVFDYLNLEDIVKSYYVSAKWQKFSILYLRDNFLKKFENFLKMLDEDIQINNKQILNWLNQNTYLYKGIKNEKGENVLHIAAKYNSGLEFLRLFIEKGVEINLQNNAGATPLHLAILKSNYKQYAEVLLSNGAKNDILDNSIKGTALSWAVLADREDLIEIFIKYGSQLPIDENGNTLLHYTAWNNYSKSTKKLLKTNIDLLSINKNGFTALELAVFNNNLDIIKILIKKMKENKILKKLKKNIRKEELSLLILAGIKKKYDIVKFLVNLNIFSKEDKYYLLYHACVKNDLELFNILLDSNINLLYRFNNGENILYIAVDHNRLEMVKAISESMIKNGIDKIGLNAQEYQRGFTALHLASLTKKLEIIKYLVSLKNINVNIHDKTKYERTAWGCVRGRKQDVYKQITSLLDQRWQQDQNQ